MYWKAAYVCFMIAGEPSADAMWSGWHRTGNGGGDVVTGDSHDGTQSHGHCHRWPKMSRETSEEVECK